MCDKLVFDLSQEVEGSPNVFIRKDWINILDNQNQNYQNNQSIIDTSQLSNSNKYMSYREAYLAVPLLLTATLPTNVTGIVAPVQGYGTGDYAIGLKNWFGQIIHSFTLDYNGTTIIQQTPFVNMWNTFKLLTTLSYNDIITQGAIIGFYPDTASSWYFKTPSSTINFQGLYPPVASMNGIYVCNNDLNISNSNVSSNISSQGNRYLCSGIASNLSGVNQISEAGAFTNGPIVPSIGLGGNTGLTNRISWINYNPAVLGGSSNAYGTVGVSVASCNQIWKSYILNQINSTNVVNGQMQINVMATIYLKQVHSFFNMIPLLKGVFMKMTMNLNNASSSITINAATTGGAGVAPNATSSFISTYTTTVPVGGVNPLHIPSFRTGSFNSQGVSALATTQPAGQTYLVPSPGVYFYNLSVGARLLGTNPNTAGVAIGEGQLARSIYLYVPAYTFNPVFEEAYLSNPVKQIKYTDIYQYQVQNIAGGGNTQFNNLITNGIANIKSVLLIPFYSQVNSYVQAGVTVPFNLPSPQYQSPFDPAGCGTTAPMVTLGNFNIQISGQNAIYNTQRYTFEEFNNQLYGQFSVNGGLTDGLTSGLIGFEEFKQSYCYYYVNVERMLPVEQSVPKSVQILGTNYSTQAIDLWVFVEYGVEINIDLVTGARV